MQLFPPKLLLGKYYCPLSTPNIFTIYVILSVTYVCYTYKSIIVVVATMRREKTLWHLLISLSVSKQNSLKFCFRPPHLRRVSVCVFLKSAMSRFHDEEHANLLNSMWLTAITFLCVGYGDIVPNTYCGRGITLTCGMVVSSGPTIPSQTRTNTF